MGTETIRPPILTPDRRLRVFISSTLEEMGPDRRAAWEAIERVRRLLAVGLLILVIADSWLC